MMPPVRCFTCGAVVGDKFEEYAEKIAAGKKPGAVLDEIGLKRYCCRRMLLTHLDIIDEVTSFRSMK
jgi:DNA-directed RNA polymerase subunit N